MEPWEESYLDRYVDPSRSQIWVRADQNFQLSFRLDAAGGLARSGCSPLPLQTKGNAFWGVHAW